jgi:hypothetical protein
MSEIESIAAGLHHAYRAGKRSMRLVRRDEDDAVWHEWRKQEKSAEAKTQRSLGALPGTKSFVNHSGAPLAVNRSRRSRPSGLAFAAGADRLIRQYTATHSNHHRMRSILRVELGDNAFHMTLHGFLGYGKRMGSGQVGIAGRD